MKIDFGALSRLTSAVTPEAGEPGDVSHEASPPPHVADAPVMPVHIATSEHTGFKTDEDGVIQPSEPVAGEPDAMQFSARPLEALPPKPPKADRSLWAWTRKLKAKPKGVPVAESSAKKTNQIRFAIIGTIVFGIGIVTAPWFFNRLEQPEVPKPMGPNAAAVVASTLTGSALGVQFANKTPDAAEATPPKTEVAGATTQPIDSKISIPPAGEGRYTAMLQTIKEPGSQAPAVVPAISVRQTPPVVGGSESIDPGVKNVKKLVPIPLKLETGAESLDAAFEERAGSSAKVADLYKVVRIERNKVGELAAYIAPIGGRDATQGTWAFVGDSTKEGFYIEAITPYHVLIRSSNGRIQQLAP